MLFTESDPEALAESTPAASQALPEEGWGSAQQILESGSDICVTHHREWKL